MVYLMSGAPFRPKYALSQTGQFSLAIHTLGELIEMYRANNATEPVDKVYALLGMSSDTHLPSQWPDYAISWTELFYQLVRFFVGEHAAVETWNQSEAAVVHSRAAVLGYVNSISTNGPWDDLQVLDLDLTDTIGFLTGQTRCWTVRTSGKLIQNGDIVCLLPGASKPMIIRPYKDYCAIVAITINPPESIDWTICLNRIKTFQVDLLLLWDWESNSGDLMKANQLDYFIQTKVAKLVTPRVSLKMREHNIGLLFADVQRYDEAFTRCRLALEGAETMAEDKRLRLLGAFDKVTSQNANRRVTMLKPEDQLSLDFVFTALSLWKDNIEIPGDLINWAVEWLSVEVVSLLLGLRIDPLRITEKMIEAAARNIRDAGGVMSILLDGLGDDLYFTEEVMKAVAGNRDKGPDVMALILRRGRDKITITQDVFVELESNLYCGRKMAAMLMEQQASPPSITVELPTSKAETTLSKLLLNQEASEVLIAEEVLLAVARDHTSGQEHMNTLFRRHGHDKMQITAEVLAAAAGNYRGAEMMRLLLGKPGTIGLVNEDVLLATVYSPATLQVLVELIGNDILVTEDMVFAAVDYYYGHPGSVSQLLQVCGDTIVTTERVMNAAAGNETGAEAMTSLLLQHQQEAAQASITERTFEAAATSGNRGVLDILYKHAVPSPARHHWHDVADLFIAAKQGDVESMKRVIHGGTNPDTRDLRGETPLCVAARYKRVEAVRFLAGREDVDVNSKSNCGWTALWAALTYESLDNVTLLLDAGANPNDVNPKGQSVAVMARECGWTGIYLLERSRRILSSLAD